MSLIYKQKLRPHLISSAPLKEVTNPKIYRNTNINNRAKTHKLVSKTRQNPNEKIHKLKKNDKEDGHGWCWVLCWTSDGCGVFFQATLDPHLAFDE